MSRQENHNCYVEGDDLVLRFRSHNPTQAKELRFELGCAIIELVQQRSEDFLHSEPVYFGLEVVLALLNEEKVK